MGHSEGSPERKFIAIQAYLKKIGTLYGNIAKHCYMSNKQPNPTSTRTGGTTTNKVQSK